jgi:hypothetical protein
METHDSALPYQLDYGTVCSQHNIFLLLGYFDIYKWFQAKTTGQFRSRLKILVIFKM